MVPRLETKSLKLGATDNRALFMGEKIRPIGAKASVVPFTKLSSEGLFW